MVANTLRMPKNFRFRICSRIWVQIFQPYMHIMFFFEKLSRHPSGATQTPRLWAAQSRSSRVLVPWCWIKLVDFRRIVVFPNWAQIRLKGSLPSLKLIFLHLKIDGCKTILSFWGGLFCGEVRFLRRLPRGRRLLVFLVGEVALGGTLRFP